MPTCKYCGARIEKFHKNDICPVCGHDHPFGDESADTIEITKYVSDEQDKLKGYNPRKRVTAFVLSCIFGFLGIHFLYLKKKKKALITFLVSMAVLAALFLVLYFVVKFALVWCILIPVFAALIINIGLGLFIILNKDYKDGEGNLLY